MPDLSAERMKALILACVERQHGVETLETREIPDDFNLLAEGVIDSLGFVQLIAELEQELGTPLDFGDLDPEELTVVGPLSRYLSQKCGSASRMGSK